MYGYWIQPIVIFIAYETPLLSLNTRIHSHPFLVNFSPEASSFYSTVVITIPRTALTCDTSASGK